MKYLPVFFVSIALLFAGPVKQEGLPGIDIETGPLGTRFVTDPAGETGYHQTASHFYGNSRAEILWVDRNHQNAIAQHTAIAGNGMWIQAGWYLNNERTSLYRTLGTATPTWSFPLPDAAFFISTDVSLTGAAIGVLSNGTPCYDFSATSTVPNWSYSLPPGWNYASSSQGQTVCVSSDGSICAALAQQAGMGRLFLFNEDGDTIRTVGFSTNSGINGVDMADDGSVICVTTYYAIYVYNADGTRRDSIANYGQTAAKISADGTYLVNGDFSTRVNLYRWNGSAYGLAWQCYTGHPWVTAVAISRGGSTIMAGTYQYSPSNAGKVLLFDSSSATPLWEYTQYGDYVASCALSANGSRAVAGSWGQYNGTFGDVVTVFDRSSATPIFQVLDDIDEPGSIFSVDISRDGSFITAGGKAVHARAWGNGGEVYAIRMLDPLANDVGIERIDAPASFLQVGQNITPQVTVRNYGTQTATFTTVCNIHNSLAQLLYADTVLVSGLASGASSTISFGTNWSVPSYDCYETRAFTVLTGDEFPNNDTLVKASICYHDGAVSSIVYPFTELTVNYSGAPRVNVANLGSYGENIPVVCEIYDGLGSLVYTGAGQSYLAPLQSQIITIAPNWSPADTGTYSAYFFTNVPEDYLPANDSATMNVHASYEILYDDGTLDVYGTVSGTYADNKFAMKMIPCLTSPYYITRCRVYLSSADPVAVSLNKDSVGLPGLAPSYYLAPPETISATVPGWALKEYATPIAMTTDEPFWMVLHWLSTSPSLPAVGMDNTQPLDNHSYWYWTDPQSPGWHAWTPYDFMMRVMTAAEVGIEDWGSDAVNTFALRAPAPNPFAGRVKITFSTPRRGGVTVSVYDVTGRLVSNVLDTPLDAGEYNVTWHGIDDRGRTVSSGIYFVKATFEGENLTRKVILLAE
ncbi:T9SS type A sorting domain-containing protein [candidate division WOR-3 bacterium]|nr:T9SS type A sorting domain-containing protein [candidate division WOR-3 bacterium]